MSDAPTQLVALTIKQPWAWLIVRPDLTNPEDRRWQCKNIENRSWATNRRGPFLIHAGKALMTDKALEAAMEVVRCGVALGTLHEAVEQALRMKPFDSYEYGGVIGQARIVDCGAFNSNPWWMGEQGFKLEEIEPLPFRPCRGALGFFRPGF